MTSGRVVQRAVRAVEPLWPTAPACPCGCGAEGLKLAAKSGHLARLCTCLSCRNRNNRARGKAGNRRAHRRLGGEGITVDDDLYFAYSINVTIESKVGNQIGASFPKFVGSERARHWFRQAEKKIPVGSDAMPALYLELAPKDAYLVVKVPSKGLR